MRKSVTPFTLESFKINGLGDTPPPPINSHEKGGQFIFRAQYPAFGMIARNDLKEAHLITAGALRPLPPFFLPMSVLSLFCEGAMSGPSRSAPCFEGDEFD
jgi:hypothetical protein